MTATIDDGALNDVTFTVYRQGTALAQLENIEPVYAEAYIEPPYNEGPDDVAEFGKGWPSRVAQPCFRLVVARQGTDVIGFTFGHQLAPSTQWWNGMLDSVESDTTVERKGRTFAIIELAVDTRWRRKGIARQLHSYLLAGLREERATLLVRPEASAAGRAYSSWGYRVIGRLQPFTEGPIYSAMMRSLDS